MQVMATGGSWRRTDSSEDCSNVSSDESNNIANQLALLVLQEEFLQVGGRKIPVLRHTGSSGGTGVAFLLDNSGLHIFFHPGANPHLRVGNGPILAEVDVEAVKNLEEEDLRSIFRRPKLFAELIAFRVPSFGFFNLESGRELNIPHVLGQMFCDKRIYLVRGNALDEICNAYPGSYVAIDRVNKWIFLIMEESPLGPMRLKWKRPPGNRQMKNLFGMMWGVMNHFSAQPESVFEKMFPEEVLAEWIAVSQAIMSQIKIFRWKKGGRQRELTRLPFNSPNQVMDLLQ